MTKRCSIKILSSIKFDIFMIISFDLNSLYFLKDNKGRNGSYSSTQLCTASVGKTVIRGTRTRVRHCPDVIDTFVNLEQTFGVLYEGYAKNFHGR